MIIVKKQQLKKKEVDRLFNSFKKEGLLQDRSEYDEQDLKLAYPQLNEKGVKLLYLKLQKWKYSKTKNKKIALSHNKQS
jgi:hypothetical protein